LLPDAQIPAETGTGRAPENRLLAPWWHTALLIIVLLFSSLNGTRGRHPLTDHSKLPQYLWGIAWEWMLLALTWLGIRKRISLRALIGGRWTNLQEVLRNVVYAAMFWICSLAVLGLGAKLMHLDQAGRIDSMRKQLGFLTPGSYLELAVWFCLSVTAGFCEEIIFRGYLQRQLATFCKSTVIGVLLSAVIFGASHGYEGVARMLLIGIYGLMFGLLAWWRNSLRPGMMAHAWHDAFSGVILRMLK
jgi:membrane protease YdiL (CAAX protease family)